jgi:CHAD domain-containing protein
VHKMRVACRRLRSTLRTFRAAFDTDRSEPLRQELRWLAGELGRSRDAEVMAAALREQVAAEPTELVIGPVVAQIGARFAGEAQQGRQQVLTALESVRYAELLEAMDEVVDAPPTIDVTASELRRMARRSLRRVDRRLSRASHIPAVVPPAQRLQPLVPGVVADRATQLHEARKAAKRARYAAEALRTSGGKAARRLIKALKRLQDQLGVYQDSVLTRQVLRELGVTAYLDGQNAFTYGLLHARQQSAAERAEREIPAASKKMRRGKARDWLG